MQANPHIFRHPALHLLFCYSGLMRNTDLPLIQHVSMLRTSYLHWTGKPLIDAAIEPHLAVAALDQAPFALVSHGTQSDPIFNYANRQALELFEMNWAEFTVLPSRFSAETVNQAERAGLLQQVSQHGYSDDYSGIRIAKSGRRFMIRNATIWNLLDTDGKYHGQAALIRAWHNL